MPIDWSNVPMNKDGAPMGHVMLTQSTPPGNAFYVDAASLVLIEEVGPGTGVIIGLHRLTVRENIREVFRRKAEANTMEKKEPPVQPQFHEQRDRVRKK